MAAAEQAGWEFREGEVRESFWGGFSSGSATKNFSWGPGAFTTRSNHGQEKRQTRSS